MNRYKTVGIIAAMEGEMELLRNSLEEAEEILFASGMCYKGKIGNHTVAAILCGIGKVSAALTVQEMIDRIRPDCIINTGCAGGIAEGLKIGDIVVSDKVSEWDLDITALGIRRGYISALDTADIAADSRLSERIASAVPKGMTVRTGRIVSGDQFISRQEQRNVILGAFPDTLCAEMEGAAVGHVCAQNRVPFCIIRCMSDTADHESEVNFNEFADKAGRTCNRILMDLLSE
ncbi:MAG: 5'-methylthioadenosine/adenosylhomocysteine nucleosidase [Clostridia bacterium]|nr:5'-methylthioadenosine/adenosylhomocysteine nucleosidase [Clostridia bacterium]